MIDYDEKMPIAAMSVGELKSLMTEIIENSLGGGTGKNGLSVKRTGPQRLVYGIKGIEELFGCSHSTAQFYKDHVIQEAVTQNGRKIIIDADYAMELFGKRKNAAGNGR